MADIWDAVKKGLSRVGVPLLANALVPGTGGLAASLVAGALGVEEEPGALAPALASATPEQLAALKQAELDHRAGLARIAAENDTARIKTVNETMRAEQNARNWWSSAWRPFWGFVSALAFGVQMVYIMILIHKVVNLVTEGNIMQVPMVLGAISTIIAALLPLWAIPGAILGVTAWHRGQMQRVKAGEAKGPGLLGALAKRISG